MLLIKKYDCEKHVYFMTTNDEMIKKVKKNYPQMRCCVGAGKAPWEMVDRAIALGAEKVQLFKPYFNQEMIDKAHEYGILCNVFYADDPDEAQKYLDMGIDCILTNDYNAISQIVDEYKKK
jgi:glycerophosphoryl diester phosphodiesterase